MAEGFIIRNVNTSLVGKDASFDLPVRQAGVEWEGDVLVHRLESLENKGVASGGRFNAMGESYVDHIDEEGWGKESDSVVIIVRVGKGATGEGIRTRQ